MYFPYFNSFMVLNQKPVEGCLRQEEEEMAGHAWFVCFVLSSSSLHFTSVTEDVSRIT
jgi:hypothetical protein